MMCPPYTLVLVACCHLLLCSTVVSSAANSTNCTVSSSGHDRPECLAGTSPCLTLRYVLSSTRSCAVVNVLASQNLSSPVSVASPRDLAVIGDKAKKSSIYVWCTNNSGIAFDSPQRVLLENLNFVGCAAISDYVNQGDYPLVEHYGVHFYRGSNVSIVGCSFSNGTGVGVIMYDVTGANLLSGSNFIGNKPGADKARNMTSGGLLIKRETYAEGVAVYHVKSCNFTENKNHANHSGFRPGGGVTLYLAAVRSTSHVVIRNCYFMRNRGSLGGGVHINQSGDLSTVVVNVSDSHILENVARGAGGGMYIRQNQGASCSLILSKSYFVNNSAEWGGGLATYNGNANGSISVEAYESYWTANRADQAGFAVGLSVHSKSKGRPNNQTIFRLHAKFRSCVFRSNMYNNLSSVGAVHMGGSKAEFFDSKFLYTYGTALFLKDSSYAVFSGNTSFLYNTRAIQGGAIYMSKNSLIALKYDSAPVFLLFHSNSAIVEGGAIYSQAIGGADTENNECVFESLSSLLNSSGKVMVNFSYNTASNEDRAIFVGSPDRCVVKSENLLFGKTTFFYYPNKTSQVASTASSITLSSKRNSTITKDGDVLQVMLGELFYLVPNATDMFHNSACLSGNLELVDPKGQFRLIGPTFIGMDNFTQHNELYISGNIMSITKHIHDFVDLYFIYGRQSTYHKGDVKLTIEIVDCRIGFSYNSSTQTCQCNPLDSLLCPPPKSYACVRYGYWYGQHNQTGGEPVECPWINCNYDDGKCAGEECPSYPRFCRLDAVDDLCRDGRGGLLCSSCRKNYSFTFGAISCVPTHTCPPGITALITLGVIAYWILFVLFVLFILSFDLSIGSGFMYGIVYYFSVLNLFTESSVTESFLMVLIDTCAALTQLSPRAFGNINACFVPSWNLNLHHKLFHFVSPVFVITVVVIVILASRYCRCPRFISLAENSPIHAICMLILFSYTSMVYTIFYILKPIKIKGEMRVFVDPHLKFFHKEHLPYAIVALLCEFILILPICFLLLFAPWLSQRVNLVKLRLKPILDEFQACYRPRYRWFAGLYFLARQLVFLAYIIPVDQTNNTFLRCTNALILIIHSTCQPYKLKWLNLLDNLLLVDLFLLSFFQLEWGSSLMRQAIPYILILPPSIYLILAVLLIILKRILRCLQSKKFFKNRIQRRQCMTTELPSKAQSATQTSVGVDEDDIASDLKPNSKAYDRSGFFRDYGEREPLLCETDPEQTSRSDGGVRRAFTTTFLRVDQPRLPNKFATN